MITAPNRAAVLCNVAGYYAGWLACVLGAAGGRWGLGALVGLVLVAAHLGLAGSNGRELRLLLAVAPLGYAVDSLQTAFGLLVFPAGQPLPWLAPLWIGVIWMLFSGTLRYTFHWLTGRYKLAAVVGAAGGPIAFYAGHRLGAVQFAPTPGLSLVVLGLAWAALLPLLTRLAEHIGGPEGGRYSVFR